MQFPTFAGILAYRAIGRDLILTRQVLVRGGLEMDTQGTLSAKALNQDLDNAAYDFDPLRQLPMPYGVPSPTTPIWSDPLKLHNSEQSNQSVRTGG